MSFVRRARQKLGNLRCSISFRDGRVVLLLMLVGYFATLCLISNRFGVRSAWKILGVPAHDQTFSDFRIVTGALDSLRLGHDPLVDNPCDPWKRPMNYPRIWLGLGSLGMNRNHTTKAGVGMAAAFFGSLLCLVGRINASQGLILGIFLWSPHVMWCVERGNIDLIVFSLICAPLALIRRNPNLRPILYGSIALGSLLKFYPIAGTLVVVRDQPRKSWIWSFVILLIFAAFLTWTRADLPLISRATQRSSDWSYGRNVLLGILVDHHGLGLPRPYLGILSVLAFDFAGLLSAFGASKFRTLPADRRELDGFLIGGAIYVLTFFLGNNWDYRMIFLTLIFPQLFTWIEERADHSLIAFLMLLSAILGVWAEPLIDEVLYGSISPFPTLKFQPIGAIFQELANWSTLILVMFMSVVVLRPIVRGEWYSRPLGDEPKVAVVG